MVWNKVWNFVVVVGVVCFVSSSSEKRECNSLYELPCNDGSSCIGQMQWCDGPVDCLDGSDEYYCDGGTPCGVHFMCGNFSCIPIEAVCDNVVHCLDGSDEANCGAVKHVDAVPEINVADDRSFAVVKATEYLLRQRNSDYNWDAFTPRAVIALSFASRASAVAEQEKQLMEKQLDIQLMLHLMQNQGNMSSSSTALYINSLLATCQDPRNFHGIDLVGRLRSHTEFARKSNLSKPLELLSLCLAGDVKYEDMYDLTSMYNRREFQRTGSKSLIVMAMVCYSSSFKMLQSYMNDFITREGNQPELVDIYTKALSMQALIAAGVPVTIDKLLSEQLPDGSFGDMLATYYAIPVLLNSNLLNLRCNSTKNTGVHSENLSMKSGGTNHVIYSLWISNGKDVDSHSLTLTFDGDKTFYEIMLMAATRDPLYRFSFDETIEGKIVYSLAGIPNDIESGRQWVLFQGTTGTVVVNSIEHLSLEPFGVDRVVAEDKKHFIFWLRRV